MTTLTILFPLLGAVGVLISIGLALAGQILPIIGYLLVIVWLVLAVYVIFFREREVDRLLH